MLAHSCTPQEGQRWLQPSVAMWAGLGRSSELSRDWKSNFHIWCLHFQVVRAHESLSSESWPRPENSCGVEVWREILAFRPSYLLHHENKTINFRRSPTLPASLSCIPPLASQNVLRLMTAQPGHFRSLHWKSSDRDQFFGAFSVISQYLESMKITNGNGWWWWSMLTIYF